MEPQGKGGVFAEKAVEPHGKGGVFATQAVEPHGKGGVLAEKAVESQGKDSVLLVRFARRLQWCAGGPSGRLLQQNRSESR